MCENKQMDGSRARTSWRAPALYPARLVRRRTSTSTPRSRHSTTLSSTRSRVPLSVESSSICAQDAHTVSKLCIQQMGVTRSKSACHWVESVPWPRERPLADRLVDRWDSYSQNEK